MDRFPPLLWFNLATARYHKPPSPRQNRHGPRRCHAGSRGGVAQAVGLRSTRAGRSPLNMETSFWVVNDEEPQPDGFDSTIAAV